MAHKIEYLVYDKKADRHPHSWDNWDRSETPPEDVNDIYGIVLDDCWYTEDVDGLYDDSGWTQGYAYDRLKLLTGRDDLTFPYSNMAPASAIAFIEAIWLDMLRQNVQGHHRVINSFFTEALKAEIGAIGYERQFDEITYNGKRLDWSVFAEIGEEAGVEYMIDAWLSGVDLEHVLAE